MCGGFRDLFLLDLTTFILFACCAHIRSSYKPLWGLMSAITAGTGAVYGEVKDDFVMNKYGLCGKETYFGRRVILACFDLICGVPATLGRFVYVFAFKSRTKTFTETTNDNAVELFCREPDAMAIKSIIIGFNMLITDRSRGAGHKKEG